MLHSLHGKPSEPYFATRYAVLRQPLGMPLGSERLDDDAEAVHAWVGEHERRQWAHGWMAGLVDGQVHWFGSDGIMMQKVDDTTIRIISVTDHEWCFRGVAFMMATFEAVDVEVQLDPYTVLMPYVEPAEAEQAELPSEPSGVEVA